MASITGFARPFRLLHSREFQRVFNHTECKSVDPYLVLLAVSNDCGHPRLGLALSKKRIKTAVARNRLKRLARESFRLHLNTLQNIDIVVIANNRAVMATNNEIFTSLDRHWKTLATRCKNS